MSLAALLQRAKAVEAGTSPSRAGAEPPWEPGQHVELDVAGIVIRGRVAFVEGIWIHWCEDLTGRQHATPSHHLTRRRA